MELVVGMPVINMHLSPEVKHSREIFLWLADPKGLDLQEDRNSCVAKLTDQEKTRYSAFRFSHHRREYLTSRVLSRTALSHALSCSQEDLLFVRDYWGKPAVTPERDISFNISNSTDLVVCLVARGIEVGVDAESLERAAEILKLAPEVFSEHERAQLNELSVPKQVDRALSLWVLKEAWVKAIGMGLSVPLHKVSFLFSGDKICLQVDRTMDDLFKRSWRFCQLEHSGHRIAVVVETADMLNLHLWNLRSWSDPPVPLSNPGQEWFLYKGSARHRGRVRTGLQS